MTSKIYINGNFVESKDAVVSVFDRGLNYGDGLFETIKARGGRPIFFSEHMERLRSSARALAIRSSLLEDVSTSGGPVEELLRLNGLDDGSARVKIVLTRGVSFTGHRPGTAADGTLIMTCSALDDEYLGGLLDKGVTAISVKSSASTFATHKTLNYLPNVMAAGEAEAAGAYEAILTGEDSLVREGAASNIFIIKDGHLRTPSADGLILPGIMRNSLILLANKLSLGVTESRVSLGELYNADECFISNSIIGALSLISVSGNIIGDGSPGPVTAKLRSALKEFDSDIKR